jgi:hypothetical protein
VEPTAAVTDAGSNAKFWIVTAPAAPPDDAEPAADAAAEAAAEAADEAVDAPEQAAAPSASAKANVATPKRDADRTGRVMCLSSPSRESTAGSVVDAAIPAGHQDEREKQDSRAENAPQQPLEVA